MATKKDVPTFELLINPTLQALHRLGGSSSIHELVDEIITDLELSEGLTDVPHGRGKSDRSRIPCCLGS